MISFPRQGPSSPFIHRKDYECCMNMTDQSAPEPLDFVTELEPIERWRYLIQILLVLNIFQKHNCSSPPDRAAAYNIQVPQHFYASRWWGHAGISFSEGVLFFLTSLALLNVVYNFHSLLRMRSSKLLKPCLDYILENIWSEFFHF